MENTQDLLALAETLERACRLASGLEGLMKDRASQNANVEDLEDVDSAEYTSWVLASELLYVLDEGRAAMVLLKAGIDLQALGGVHRKTSSGA